MSPGSGTLAFRVTVAVLARGCVLYKYQEEFQVHELQLHHGSEVLLYHDPHVKAAAIAGICVPSHFSTYSAHTPHYPKQRGSSENYYVHQHSDTREGQAFSLDV